MNLLHVVPTYFPSRRYGGTLISVHGLCKSLSDLGHDVHVFTTNVDGPGDTKVPLGTPVEREGVKVWYFRSKWLRRLYWSPSMKRAFEKEADRFDLIHLHSVFLWPIWMAARRASQKGKPYVVSPRGMLVEDLIRRKSTLAKTMWIEWIEKKTLARAAAIHATSVLEANEMRRLGLALAPVHVIPNGVEGRGNEEGMASAVVRSVLEKHASFILFIGRVHWKKGLDRLILAMSRLPGVPLVIAGNDEEGYTSFLKELAKSSGVSNRVIFTGPAYAADKRSLFNKASLFVLPSYSENFGNVVLEAMQAGCPVAVTPEVGSAAIVEATGAGIIVEGKPQALAAGIGRLLEDRSLLESMGRKGRQAVAAAYTWGVVAVKMEGLYQKVLSGGNDRV